MLLHESKTQHYNADRVFRPIGSADAGDPGLGDDAAGFGGDGDDEEDMEREAPELLEPPERRCSPSARLAVTPRVDI